MKVIYKFYTPNQGLEEIQARIFNHNTGFNATAEEIRERYKRGKTNPHFIRYAFSEEGQPLAYVQARVAQDKSILIGYPWAYPECPEEVQNVLFDEMLAYILQKEPKQINYWIRNDWEKQTQFFERKGFRRTIEGFCYLFDVKDLSQRTSEDLTYHSRVATLDDLEFLIEIGSIDKELKRLFSRSWLQDYFTNKVLKDGHCILVFDNEEQIVCASAPLRWKEEAEDVEKHIMLRFTATRPGNERAWETLVIALAKECTVIEWTDLPIRVDGKKGSEIDQILKKYNPESTTCYDLFTLTRET